MAALAAVGVSSGAAVAVMFPNGPDVVAALFAVWALGAVYVPVNPRLTPGEVDALLDAVRPAAIVSEAGVVARPAPAASGDGVAIVSFTSGTTGRPRPVPLTHDRILGLLDKVIGTLRTTPGGGPPMPNLIPVSLSLWAGIYQVLFAFRVGAAVVLMDGFDTAEFGALVRRFGIRSTVLPPAAMVMLCDDDRITDLAPLKYVRSISSPLSPLQARRFRDRFGVSLMNCYGQTELGGEVVGWSAADTKQFGDDKLGAVGRPHAGVEVRVADDGELLVRTPDLIQGVDEGRLLPGGWFRTGDIGRVDDDGFVWVEGRKSDMINRGGLKVHPAEVEEVLRLLPEVVDAAVVGVADDRLGEVPWAFCVMTAPLAPARLEAHCRAHVAPYKVPAEFRVVSELPRNEAGKVLKRHLVAAG
jgi:acyl-CoA synthetase (AMP-forming)/AMP-acid ligase II